MDGKKEGESSVFSCSELSMVSHTTSLKGQRKSIRTKTSLILAFSFFLLGDLLPPLPRDFIKSISILPYPHITAVLKISLILSYFFGLVLIQTYI